MENDDVTRLLDNLAQYVKARVALLGGLRAGNRDPLVEWTEQLVAVLMNGRLATSPVQKGWDVEAAGQLVQVKYLANTAGKRWANWHDVRTDPGVDWYAVVILESFLPLGVLVFPRNLTQICLKLGKHHGNQDSYLSLQEANVRSILANSDQFEALGMKVFDLRENSMAAAERAGLPQSKYAPH